MKPNQLRNFDTFIKNLFDDKMAHEILQLKSGKNKTLNIEKMDTKDILTFILTNKNETSITTMEKYLYKIIDTYKKLTDY